MSEQLSNIALRLMAHSWHAWRSRAAQRSRTVVRLETLRKHLEYQHYRRPQAVMAGSGMALPYQGCEEVQS